MYLGLLHLIEVLKDEVLNRTGKLFHRTIEQVERLGAHPEGKTVDVHRRVWANASTVCTELLEAECKGWPNELLPVKRRVGKDQDLTTRADGRNNAVTVREPLAASRVRRALNKLSDVLLIGESHKHWILR